MKKSILFILSAVVIVAAAAIAIIAINNSSDSAAQTSNRAKVEDMLFCYLNLDQFAKKGVFEKHFTPEQRRMWASMATANIQNREVASHMDGIIQNFNNSGIDFTKPLYGYCNNANSFVVVAEVADVCALDKTIESISYLLEQEGEEPIIVEQEGDNRSFFIEESAACSYNDERITIVVGAPDCIAMLLNEAHSRLLADLSIFGDSDAAIYINANKAKEIAIAEQQTTNIPFDSTLLQELFKYAGEDAHIISSLTFDPGRITCAYDCYNFNITALEEMVKKSNGNHLEYISKDAIAVVNLGINGKKISESITRFIDSELAAQLGIYLRNEERMIMAVVCDAIESIDGDTTIALESIDGEIVERIDYYTGRLSSEPRLKSVKAAVMMDVTDNYIITNVGQYSMGLLRKAGDNHYMGQFGNFAITLQQNEGLLFGGVNMKPTKSENPATEAKWAKEIKESYYYFIVDFDNLMGSEFMASANKAIANAIDYEYRDMYLSLTNMFSYAYSTSNELLRSQAVVVLDNKEANALEQLSDVIIPVVIKEVNASIF